MLHGGLSIRGDGIERYKNDHGNYKYNLGYSSITYNQPATLFNAPSRRNVELGYMIR